jgi:uncharacterized protein (TIGR02594 family)
VTLKTSLIITGNSSVAKKAVEDLAASVAALGTGAKAVAEPLAQVDQAQTAAANSAKEGAAAADQLDAAHRKGAGGAREAAQASTTVQTSQAGASTAAGAAAAAQQGYGQSMAKTASEAKALSAANDQVNTSVASVGAGAKAATEPLAQVSAAQTAVADSAKEGAVAAEQLDAAYRKGAGGARDVAQASTTVQTSQSGVSTAARAAATAQQNYGQAMAQTATEAKALSAANDEVAASGGAATEQLEAIAGAQSSATGGATAHAAAISGLDANVKKMIAQVAGGSTAFDAMSDNGNAFAAALAAVAASSTGAASGVAATGESGEAASVDLSGLGDTVVDVAGKAEGMGGKLGSVASILGGPWGAAIGIGINLLGGFASGLIEAASETDDLSGKSLSLVDALDKEKFATEGARAAIKAYNEQQERARKETELSTRATLAKAEADIKEALSVRQKTQATLADAEARVKIELSAQPGDEGGIAVGLTAAGIQAAAIKKQLDEGKEAINELLQTRRNLLIQVGSVKGEAAADPAKAIDLKYNLQRQQAEEAAKSNTKLARTIDQTVAAIERQRAAEKKAYEESQARTRKPREVSLGNQLEAGSAAQMLATAERYRGLSENKAGDRNQLRDLFKQANVSIDPTMVAWCAAFVNSVLATNGIKGTGSLSARSFLGFGQSTDTPNKGDIVVSKRGNNAAQGHVGFYQGTDAKGNILVLGGNTSDKVGTQAIARSNVLGFRQAPTAADAYKDSLKEAEDAKKIADAAAKEQQRNLDQVVAKYLPATAAAKDYAEELAKIDALAASYDGKNATSGLTVEQATAARVALKAANDKKMAEINLTPEAKAANEAKKSIDGVIASVQQETAARKAANPVEQAMIEHRKELAELAKTDPAAAAAREAELRGAYAQRDAVDAVAEATRAAADAQRQFRDMALDAFDAIVLGGQNAGEVIDRLAQTIASAAIEAAVLGTGPLAALLKGGGTATPAAVPTGGGSTGQAAADILGKSVGKSVGDKLDGVFGKGNSGKILQNAGFGYTAASITGGSGIGGGIGGALGGQVASKLLTSTLGSFAGPLGSIAGGILGGVVGKLFSGKPKEYGSSAISIDGGIATAGAAIGKGTSEREKASALGGSVADGLNQIAQQLGGALGSANVSIGYRPGHKAGAYRVDTSGGGKVTGVEAFETEAEAIAYAIRDAITDGAVTGLSAAVQKAIQSSTDVDKALAEALKVQDLEVTMGGITGQIDKAFREFEVTAKERVRIATQYGFDLVAIEKKNGEDRAKLAAQLASEQVGSLQKLIEEMTQGSLFEGTAMDKIATLNTAIDKAKADLANGVEGAGDTLAGLYQQKLATSKEAYGTTSGYTADRTAILDDARNAVTAANARIAAAQSAKTTTDPALVTTNATLDEIAEQNAKQLAAQNETNKLLTALVSVNDYSPRLLDGRLASV